MAFKAFTAVYPSGRGSSPVLSVTIGSDGTLSMASNLSDQLSTGFKANLVRLFDAVGATTNAAKLAVVESSLDLVTATNLADVPATVTRLTSGSTVSVRLSDEYAQANPYIYTIIPDLDVNSLGVIYVPSTFVATVDASGVKLSGSPIKTYIDTQDEATLTSAEAYTDAKAPNISGDTASGISVVTSNGTSTVKLNDTLIYVPPGASTVVHGSASQVAQLTINQQGRIVGAQPVDIQITSARITDLSANAVTALSGTANQVTVTGGTTGSLTLSLPTTIDITGVTMRAGSLFRLNPASGSSVGLQPSSASTGVSVTFYGGNATASGGTGGHTSIRGGASGNNGTSGNVYLEPGDLVGASATRGSVYVGTYSGATVNLGNSTGKTIIGSPVAFSTSTNTGASGDILVSQGASTAPTWQSKATALSAYALLASPTFTGTPAAPTALAGTNTTQIATTAFVTAAVAAASSAVTSVNGLTGAVVLGVSNVSGAAPLASPTFTGTPLAPTATAGTNTTQVATTAFVTAAVSTPRVTALTGTANQVGVSASTGSVTLSLPATIDVTGVTLRSGAVFELNPASGASITLQPSPAATAVSFTLKPSYSTTLGNAGGTLYLLGGDGNGADGGDVTIGGGYPTGATSKYGAVNIGTTAAPASAVNIGASGTTTTLTGIVAFAGLSSTTFAGTATFTGSLSLGSNALATTPSTTDYSTKVATTEYVKNQLASPALTGTPTAPTAGLDANTTQIATTAFVVGQAASSTPAVNGTGTTGTSLRYARADHVHPTDTTRAPLASPTFTGTVTIPAGASISGYLTSATAASTYAPLASPTFTGTPTAPTASVGTNTTQIATTAYVQAQGYASLAGATFTGKVNTPAATSSAAGLNVAPTTTVPTSPVNGDIWVTSAGLFARINGATVQLSVVTSTSTPYDFSGEPGGTPYPNTEIYHFKAVRPFTLSSTGHVGGCVVAPTSTTTFDIYKNTTATVLGTITISTAGAMTISITATGTTLSFAINDLLFVKTRAALNGVDTPYFTFAATVP